MNDFVSFLVEFFASYFLWIMFAGIFALWVFDGKIKKEEALHALFAAILAWIIAHIIKAMFPTLRPFQVNGDAVKVIIPLANGAFPSGHTAAAFGLAVTVWLHDKKMGIVYFLAAILVGIARILANVHYPIDIIGGAAVGTGTAYLFQKVHFRELINKIFRKK